MKSDFFVFYIAYLRDGKQRDFWEQGQNPAVLSPSWILANQWILLALSFVWRQVHVNKKDTKNSSFLVRLLLLSAVAYCIRSLSPVWKERPVAAEEDAQFWIWADRSAYRSTFTPELKHPGGVSGQAWLSAPSRIASTLEEHWKAF